MIKKLRPLVIILILIGSWSSACAQADIKPLLANHAFQFSAQVKDHQTLIFSWKIAPGYYLYKDRFHFKVLNSPNTQLSSPLYPAAIDKYIADRDHYKVYMNQVSVGVPVLNAFDTSIIVQVSYQGCSQQGFCYPPMLKNVNLNLTGDYMQPTAGSDVISSHTSTAKAPIESQQVNKLTQLINKHNLLLIIFIFFGLGTLMSLTPCVLPMIPILSSIIVGSKSKSPWHTFRLSLAYVLGMAIAYALAGVLFGFLGANIQPLLQSPFIIALFSVVFILMGLSMLGAFQIQLPQCWLAKISNVSEQQKRGSYLGVFGMGLLASIILSPCVTPPLVGVLAYISHQGNIAIGAIALFCLGLGVGVPLLVIGALGSHFLPKAGRWMLAINQIMGLLLFAVALWLLARIIPATWGSSLWAIWIIVCAIFLGAFTTSKGIWPTLKKLMAILIFTYAILVFTGIFTQSKNPFAPTQLRRTEKPVQLNFIKVYSLADVQQILHNSSHKNQPLLMVFYADWCTSCQLLDHFTFTDPLVMKQLRQMVLIKADITHYNASAQEMMRHYGVLAPPTLLFFDKNHKIIKKATIIGDISAKDLLAHLHALPSR